MADAKQFKSQQYVVRRLRDHEGYLLPWENGCRIVHVGAGPPDPAVLGHDVPPEVRTQMAPPFGRANEIVYAFGFGNSKSETLSPAFDLIPAYVSLPGMRASEN